MAEPYYDEDGITIYCGDAREVLPDLVTESVGLVLTDPPYPERYAELWPMLGEQSARLLPVGGSLVTLCGHYQVPFVCGALGLHLRYWWIGGMSHWPNAHRLIGKNVVVTWKPALWFVRERLVSEGPWPMDLRAGKAQDKDHHEWGQPVDWFSHWVGALTESGGLVLDPFMGAGTTLVAAKRHDRRAIGVDISERYCEIAAKRLAQGVMDFGGVA